MIAIHQTTKDGNWGNKHSVHSKDDDSWNSKIVTDFYGPNITLAKTVFLSDYRLSISIKSVWGLVRATTGSVQLQQVKAMDDDFSSKAIDFMNPYLAKKSFIDWRVLWIECILYGNGRMMGTLKDLCKSTIAEFYDTNFMYEKWWELIPSAHRNVKWFPNTKQNLDPMKYAIWVFYHSRKRDDNRRDSCLIYRNYIRNPLKLADKFVPLRNTAVILNGACSNTILKVISFWLVWLFVPSCELGEVWNTNC